MTWRSLELLGELQSFPKDEPVWFYPHAGNAGDALILSACWRLFQDAGLDARLVPEQGFDATGRIVVVGGGGNLVPMYQQVATFLRRHHASSKRLLVLPHTIEGHEDILALLGPNTVLACREPVSLEHCRRSAPRARSILTHDLALDLDPREFPLPRPVDASFLALILRVLARRTMGRRELPSGALVRRARRYFHAFPEPNGSGVLNAFRIDVESAGAAIPPQGNQDLSEGLRMGVRTKADADFNTSLFLHLLDKWKTIRTDRLHVCIGAALLGKEVEFHPNSTHKCRSIWMHSIQSRFPKVRWAGAEETPK